MYKIITSYPNPDTDGVACMIGVNHIFPDYKPLVVGFISCETIYVLDKLKIELPERTNRLDAAIEEIVLVDTHHKAQLGDEFPFDKVVRIIDHHPAGDDELFSSALIDNRKIGAAASIVGDMLLKHRIMDEKVVKLLQYAIASNTLNFTAPSVSEYDKEVFGKLQDIYAVTENEIDIMFSHRTYNSVLSDIKYFDYLNGRIAIAQLELYGTKIDDAVARKELKKIKEEKNLLFAILNCVNIKKKVSHVIFSEGISDSEARRIFGFDVKKGLYDADRILLRKTDYIPFLMCSKKN